MEAGQTTEANDEATSGGDGRGSVDAAHAIATATDARLEHAIAALARATVYEALGDAEEEAKCLELALRKFPKHPLLPMLKEHIVYRMHESSLTNRESAYRIILLSLRAIASVTFFS